MLPSQLAEIKYVLVFIFYFVLVNIYFIPSNKNIFIVLVLVKDHITDAINPPQSDLQH